MIESAVPSDAPARAVVVVNFGSHALLERTLAPLDLGSIDARAVVVDSYHSLGERRRVLTTGAKHGWTVLTPDRNVGFGSGVNLGIDTAIGLGCRSFVMLNPDAFTDVPALATLFDRVESNPSTLAAPRVVRPDGSVWFGGARVDVRAGRTRSADDVAGDPTAWLTGACLAIHADLYARTGGFDPAYFLYWEDVDLSWRAIRAGATLAVLDEVTVTHDVGGTQEGAAKSPTYVYYNCRNRLVFAARNLGRADIARWLATTPRYGWLVLHRGGRRALARHPVGLGWAALRGSLAGMTLGFGALLGRRRPYGAAAAGRDGT